ncbi:MAG: hypothetical protein ACI959_002062 [Limisphaerales bacterium]|jgi:hypothetical protein
MTRALAILNLIAFAGTVIVNALANVLPINGFNTGELSDMYPNLFVPAGFTFSIWGVIYLGLLVFVIAQLITAFKKKPNDEDTITDTIGIWFIASSFANCAWILAWHNLLIGLSVVIMALILISLIAIYERIKQVEGNAKFYSRIPFSIYLGWISIAIIANITALLVHFDWNGLGIEPEIWTVLMMIIGSVLALIYLTKNNDLFYPLVVAWALFGIYSKRSSELVEAVPLVINAAAIGTIIMLLLVIGQFIRTRKLY